MRNSSHADIWALKVSGLLECDAVLPKRRCLFTEVRRVISGMFVILIMRMCASSEMRSATPMPSFIQICRQFCGQTHRQQAVYILCGSSSFLSFSLPVCPSVSKYSALHKFAVQTCTHRQLTTGRSVSPSRCPVAAAAHCPPGQLHIVHIVHIVHTALSVRGAGIAQSV